MNSPSKWGPKPVDGIGMAFGEDAMKLLPPMKDIPEEFQLGRNRWNKVVTDWFFLGLKDAKWKPKAGVDQTQALRHVSTCMRSWEPKHEHKEAGCAFLLSEFFDDVTYTAAKPTGAPK